MYGSIGVIGSVAVLFLVSTSFAANPYQLGRVAYFHEGSLTEAVHKKQRALDWREPHVGFDGHVSYYVPPGQVVALLENPTEENAKAYLDWQKEKTDKLLKAQEVIQRALNK